jgi:hypothetical protein
MLFDVHVVMHILLVTQQVNAHIKENIFPQKILLKVKNASSGSKSNDYN